MAKKQKPFKTSLITCSSCGSVFSHSTRKDNFPTECSDCRDVEIFKPEI